MMSTTKENDEIPRIESRETLVSHSQANTQCDEGNTSSSSSSSSYIASLAGNGNLAKRDDANVIAINHDDIIQYLPTVSGEELTVEVNGEMYVISAVIDEDDTDQQLMKILNVTEGSDSMNQVIDEQDEPYDPSDLIIVRENDALENQMMLLDSDNQHRDTDLIEAYPIMSGNLEAEEIVLHSEISQDIIEFQPLGESQLCAESVENPKALKRKKTKVRNKDIMQLPFSYNGQTFTVQAQKLILNVVDFFKRTEQDPYALKKLGTLNEQAAKVLNVSSGVIGKIRNRYRTHKRIIVPTQVVSRTKHVLDRVDKKKETIIRNIVRDLTKNKINPTVNNVMTKALEKDAFQGSQTSFRRVLRRMRFKFMKSGNKMLLVDPSSSI